MPARRIMIMETRSTTMATAVTAVHWNELSAIFHIAQTASIGALTIMLMARPMYCWMW